jgi:hypothetical protein
MQPRHTAIFLSGCLTLAAGLASAEPYQQAEAARPVLSEEQLPRLRPVMRGALYRSGTPSEEALNYLCESGWKRVYSLYGEYTTQTGPRNQNMLRHGRDRRTCSADGAQRAIEWRAAPSSRMRNLPIIFRDIVETVRNPDRGPVLVHCWNGLHYAGMVSALALRQFCGLSAEQAEAYWRANANRGANYPLIIANLKAFKPLPELTLTPEEQQAVCPNLNKGYMVTHEAFQQGPLPGVVAVYGQQAPEVMTRASDQMPGLLQLAPPMSPVNQASRRAPAYLGAGSSPMGTPSKPSTSASDRTVAQPGKG